MIVQHENRSGKDRRSVELYLRPSTFIDRRWHRDPRARAMDEDDVYDPDWEISDGELEQYAKISLDD